MTGTSRKTVKRPASPQTAKRKKGARSAKRAKKGASSGIVQALLLAGMLIIAAVIISMGVQSVKQGREQQADAASAPPMALPVSAILDTTAPEAPQEAEKPAPPAVAPPTPAPPATAKKPPAQEPQNRQPAKAPAVKTPAAKPAAIPQPPPKPQYQGTLVFIIDDAGNNLQELEPFLRFPGPLTIAVLPGLPHSTEAARRSRAAGKEVFLHQPMEAMGGQAPGPGAIYAGMTAAEIVALLRKNVAEIGPIAGMNNHQGSKITTDQQMMETVLAFCRDQRICFLDSRTTAETAVPAAARKLGVKIGERNIFIDNEQTRASMNRYIENGLTLASQKGSAVMIGHTWSPELAPLLADLYQTLTAQGYTFAAASSLIK
jgi:polysaccharide deacetylase 2 family uncharacterized protein YibQ